MPRAYLLQTAEAPCIFTKTANAAVDIHIRRQMPRVCSLETTVHALLCVQEMENLARPPRGTRFWIWSSATRTWFRDRGKSGTVKKKKKKKKKKSGWNPYFGSHLFAILVIMFAHSLSDLPLLTDNDNNSNF